MTTDRHRASEHPFPGTLLFFAAALLVWLGGCATKRLAPRQQAALQHVLNRALERDATCSQRIERHRADNQVDLGLLERHVAEQPGDWQAAYRLARTYNATERGDDAARVAAAFPGQPNAFLLSERARAAADPKAREALARESLSVSALHADAVFQLGMALFQQGCFADAAAQFELYVGLRGFDSGGWNNLYLSYAYSGDRAKAVAACWACIMIEMQPGKPTSPRRWQGLAALYEGSILWPEASAWFRSRAGGDDPSVLRNLPPDRGLALLPPPSQCADMALAVATGEQVGVVTWVGRFSVNDRAGVRIGDVVKAINGPQLEADADWWTLNHAVASIATPGQEVVFSILREGSTQELRAVAGKDADLLARMDTRLAEASRFFSVGDFVAAAAAYEDVLGISPLNEAALAGLLEAKSRLDDKAAIISALRPLVATYPQDSGLAYSLAYWQARAGKWEELRVTLDNVHGWHPGHGGLIALRGWLAIADNDAGRGRESFELALCMGHGMDALRRLGGALDEVRRKAQERDRLAAATRERSAAERKRQTTAHKLMLMQMLLRGSSGGGVPGVSTVPTGPTILQQWSNQQNQNMMWSHNR